MSAILISQLSCPSGQQKEHSPEFSENDTEQPGGQLFPVSIPPENRIIRFVFSPPVKDAHQSPPNQHHRQSQIGWGKRFQSLLGFIAVRLVFQIPDAYESDHKQNDVQDDETPERKIFLDRLDFGAQTLEWSRSCDPGLVETGSGLSQFTTTWTIPRPWIPAEGFPAIKTLFFR